MIDADDIELRQCDNCNKMTISLITTRQTYIEGAGTIVVLVGRGVGVVRGDGLSWDNDRC